ncbi:hypothetical protein [Streptomyces sp. NEAU-NA10]|uniref:hypothetical protein n=1 Tax=Streptomyces sp. NEAU-NA10 TaxID=3416050 RepID=UPI003CC653DB
MSPTKPTTTDDAAEKQRVFPADFEEFVTTTAAGLGNGWTVDTDSKPHPGLSAYLIHPDGRRIGIRHIWRGAAVQTWALDVPPREFDNDADAETYADSLKHLTPGIRYNVGVCFTNNPPAATTARNIRTRLLPAFDGKRPRLRAFPKKPSRRTAAAEKPSAAADATKSSEPTQATDPSKPAKATAKSTAPARSPRRTAKKAQPTAKKTEPKKQPAAPRSKRTTATATKTAGTDETKAKKKSQSAETNTSN